MSLTHGHQAIIRRLVEANLGTNLVLPNGQGAALPRYVVQEAGGSQQTRTLHGLTEAYAEVSVRVETQAGEYATENNTLVATLVGLFPVGARFDGVEIKTAADVRPAFMAGDGVYAVPVLIKAHFSF